MRTRAGWVLALSALLAGLCGCASAGPSDNASVQVRVASLKGPTTMGLVRLIADAQAEPALHPYRVSVLASPEEIVTPLVKGEVDVALLPTNLAAVLYRKTHGAVRLVAVNTLGVLQVVTLGADVRSLADLKGRTILSTGKGASPEYVLNHLLAENGLDPARDVTVSYASESTEVASRLVAAGSGVAVLPQPFVTILRAQHPAVRVALDLTREWERVNPDSTLVTGVAVVRTAFAAAHPDLVRRFLADYRTSTAFTNEHPDEAAPLIVAAGIAPTADVARQAIPECHIVYLSGAEARAKVTGYLRVLFDADPASVGGTLPDDDFFAQP